MSELKDGVDGAAMGMPEIRKTAILQAFAGWAAARKK
jgi:hypothetical protein